MTTSGSITTWIDLLKTGDEEAAARLWDRYFARLVELARYKMRRLPKSTQDEEDVALSAFHTVFRATSENRLPKMKNRDDLWQTLVVITAGKAVDVRRREYSLKRGGNSQDTEAWNEPSAALTPMTVLDDLLSRDPDPAFAIIVEEELQSLLQRLEDPELEEIAVAKLEGYTNDEIAQRLGCNVRTVKRRTSMIRRIWECVDESTG